MGREGSFLRRRNVIGVVAAGGLLGSTFFAVNAADHRSSHVPPPDAPPTALPTIPPTQEQKLDTYGESIGRRYGIYIALPATWGKDRLDLLNQTLGELPHQWYAPQNGETLQISYNDDPDPSNYDVEENSGDASIPVVSAGDFSPQHPLQALETMADKMTDYYLPGADSLGEGSTSPKLTKAVESAVNANWGSFSFFLGREIDGRLYNRQFVAETPVVTDRSVPPAKRTFMQGLYDSLDLDFRGVQSFGPRDFIRFTSDLYVQGRKPFIDRMDTVISQPQASSLYTMLREKVFFGKIYPQQPSAQQSVKK